MDNLPRVRGLTAEQQARLDAELTARKLTNSKAQRMRPMEVVAALQSALQVDATSIFAAYGDAESLAIQAATDKASIQAVNDDVAVEGDIYAYTPSQAKAISKRGRRSINLDLTSESEA